MDSVTNLSFISFILTASAPWGAFVAQAFQLPWPIRLAAGIDRRATHGLVVSVRLLEQSKAGRQDFGSSPCPCAMPLRWSAAPLRPLAVGDVPHEDEDPAASDGPIGEFTSAGQTRPSLERCLVSKTAWPSRRTFSMVAAISAGDSWILYRERSC